VLPAERVEVRRREDGSLAPSELELLIGMEET
jgi:hypothetical protein